MEAQPYAHWRVKRKRQRPISRYAAAHEDVHRPRGRARRTAAAAGQEFELSVIDGWLIDIETVRAPMRLVEDGGLLVLEAEEPVEPLLDEQVREVIELDRADREQRWT
jgi:hypothetical protein